MSNYNIYSVGTAPNYFTGDIKFDKTISSNTGNITFTYAGTSANNLNLAANNVLLEIPSFTDHTNRISGVTTSSNPLTLPDYQVAMSIGRQVLTITNQSLCIFFRTKFYDRDD